LWFSRQHRNRKLKGAVQTLRRAEIWFNSQKTLAELRKIEYDSQDIVTICALTDERLIKTAGSAQQQRRNDFFGCNLNKTIGAYGS
jgi:hypothetical protein